MKLLAIGILSLALNLSAFAVETNICVITSDIDAEKTDMLIETNSAGELDSVRLYKTLGTSVVYDETFPVEKVVDQGIVAAEREGRDVVILKAKNFSFTQGGIITVDYLFNGIKNQRKAFNLKLQREGSKYVLTTVAGEKVNRIKFIGNRAPIVNTLIGIKEVRTSFR